MHKLFNFLYKKNLIRRNKLELTRLNNLSSTQVIDFSKAIVDFSKVEIKSDQTQLFSHCASSSLAGGAEVCANPECRIQKLDSLARFSILYSDHVYINNYFSKYTDQHFLKNKESRGLIKSFANDLKVLFYIKPLIETGKIRLATPDHHICPGCLANIKYGENAAQRMDKAIIQLNKAYEKHTNAYLVFLGKEYAIECSGPEPYYEHGGGFIVLNKSSKRIISHSLFSAAKQHGKVKIPLQVLKKIGFISSFFVGNVVKNMAFDVATSQLTNTSFVTDNRLDINFLDAISQQQTEYIEERNNVAFKHLTSEVPFLADVAIGDLIKLRDSEQESFILFRQALNEAIDQFVKERNIPRSSIAKAIFQDVVYPHLTMLDKKVKLAKKSLRIKPVRTLGSTMALLSFGLFTGFVPAELKPIASLFGSTLGGTQFIKDLLAINDAENDIKMDKFYFLWKVKNKVRSVQ